MKKSLFLLSIVSFTCILSACGATRSNNSYQNEFASLGLAHGAAPGMNRADTEAAIERAYLDGTLTAEQARKAHIQLQLKGHQTAEEIAVINRDRLANRGEYETKKEGLDIVRDTAQTGTSVLADINNMRGILESIFD